MVPIELTTSWRSDVASGETGIGGRVAGFGASSIGSETADIMPSSIMWVTNGCCVVSLELLETAFICMSEPGGRDKWSATTLAFPFM